MFKKSMIKYLVIIIFSFFLNIESYAIEKLDGTWFECEFSGKTTPPTDNCKMLDNDGFIFSKNIAQHITVLNSIEKKCKKNKFAQCFPYTNSIIDVIKGREDKVNFIDGKLILSFLGCNQTFHLKKIDEYVEAVPDQQKCFWTGKKVFYLRKYNGKLIFKN
jgi:hypothetical protein